MWGMRIAAVTDFLFSVCRFGGFIVRLYCSGRYLLVPVLVGRRGDLY